MSLSFWSTRKANSTESILAARCLHGKLQYEICGSCMEIRSSPAVFEGHQFVEDTWKKNGSKQERLAERKRQISSVLPLVCLMS